MNLPAGQTAKILVVGGGGFIGSWVVDCLVKRGIDVVVLDVHKPEGVDPAVDWVLGTSTDEPLMASVARGCSSVIFLAAHSLPASSNHDLSAEVSGHVRVVVKAAEICCAQNVGCFVFGSSGGTIYDPTADLPFGERSPIRPVSAYGVSKAAIEGYLSVLTGTRGMRTVSLRLSNPFGPGQTGRREQGFIAAALNAQTSGGTLQCWGSGNAVRDFVYVEDVAEAFRLASASERVTGAINIGSGVGRTLNDVVRVIEEVGQREIAIVHLDERAVDVPRNVLDIALAATELDWRPTTDFRDGIARTLSWVRESKRRQHK